MTMTMPIPFPERLAERSPVSSYNEWDPLEEVVVGVVDGAAVPPGATSLEVTVPADQKAFFLENAGRPFPAERIDAARRDLEELVHILEAEGVTVRRPEPRDFARRYATPEWESTGLYAAMPRDLLIVVGDEIIECPARLAVPRYFEMHAYRPLLKEYFRQGRALDGRAAAPVERRALRPGSRRTPERPSRFRLDHHRARADLRRRRLHALRAGPLRPAEPRHQRVRHRVDAPPPRGGYRVHEVEVRDPHPMHIDATLDAARPGQAADQPGAPDQGARDLPRLGRPRRRRRPPSASATRST